MADENWDEAINQWFCDPSGFGDIYFIRIMVCCCRFNALFGVDKFVFSTIFLKVFFVLTFYLSCNKLLWINIADI